jgi:hypothetical protein
MAYTILRNNELALEALTEYAPPPPSPLSLLNAADDDLRTAGPHNLMSD